jgi:hypothetical protein
MGEGARLGVLLYYSSPCMKIRFASLARWRERAGVRVAMIFPPHLHPLPRGRGKN